MVNRNNVDNVAKLEGLHDVEHKWQQVAEPSSPLNWWVESTSSLYSLITTNDSSLLRYA